MTIDENLPVPFSVKVLLPSPVTNRTVLEDILARSEEEGNNDNNTNTKMYDVRVEFYASKVAPSGGFDYWMSPLENLRTVDLQISTTPDFTDAIQFTSIDVTEQSKGGVLSVDTLSGGADEEEKEEKSGDELAAARAAAVVLFFHHVSVSVPLWNNPLYVKVRTSKYLDVGYTFSQWSGSSIPWTVTSDCEVDQFLNLSITSTNLQKNRCQQCPVGGSCRDPVTQYGIIAKFGFWQCPQRDLPAFSPCPFGRACLGAPNVDLRGMYMNSDGTDPALEERKNATCWSPAHQNPTEGNQRCTRCATGYVERGDLGMCSQCSEDATSAFVVVVLLIVLSSIILVVLVVLKVRSSGGKKAEHSVMKRILVSHLQLMGIVMSMNVNWPKELVDSVQFVSSVTTVSRHLSAMKCYAGTTRERPLPPASFFYGSVGGVYVLAPFLSLVAYLYWYCLATRSRRLRCNQELKKSPTCGECAAFCHRVCSNGRALHRFPSMGPSLDFQQPATTEGGTPTTKRYKRST